MEFLSAFLLKIGLAILAVTGVFIGHHFLKMKDDNFIEETVEDQLERELGLDIDLTPDSKEVEIDPSKHHK